jgi:hypothetical protein
MELCKTKLYAIALLCIIGICGFLLLVIDIQEIKRGSPDSRMNGRPFRKLRHVQGKRKTFSRYKDHEYDFGILGNSHIIPKKTVYGTIVTTNPDLMYQEADLNATMTLETIRSESVANLSQEVPFPLAFWPALFTKPCPNSLGDNKKERGLANAHLRIWQDFIYFDIDVLEAHDKNISEPLFRHSHSGTFAAYPNKTIAKNGIPFLEEDIIVVLEDDVEIVVVEANISIVEELTLMNTDIMWLGWCDGRKARPVPLCAHAYALTRRGARKLVDRYEPCGLALDEQLVVFCKNKWVTYSTIHDWSWKSRYKPGYPRPGDKNYGIFRQNKVVLGSFLGH